MKSTPEKRSPFSRGRIGITSNDGKKSLEIKLQLFFSSSFSCFCLIVLTWTSLLQNYSWDPFSVWLPDSKLYRTSAWFWLGSKYGDQVGLFYCHFEGLHWLLCHHSTPLPHAFWPSLNSCRFFYMSILLIMLVYHLMVIGELDIFADLKHFLLFYFMSCF